MTVHLRASDLAAKVDLTRQQIHRLACAGGIPGTRKAGKQFRFDPDDTELLSWIARKNAAKIRPKTEQASARMTVTKPPFSFEKLAKDDGVEGMAYGVGWLARETVKMVERLGGANMLTKNERALMQQKIKPFVELYRKL